MDWIKQVNDALLYIEEHITEDLAYEKIANIAGCPTYYFQKVFLFLSNKTLKEYIRLRRLSLAAVDLQKGNQKVIDVALRYGYDSPTSFNRAFQKFHGVAPSAVKKGSVCMKSYPPLHLSMEVQGGVDLSFRIEQKERFRVVGLSCPLDKDLEKNFMVIPGMWDQALEDGTLTELLSLMNDVPKGLMGVSIHHEQNWKYLIAVSSNKTSERFETYDVPACSWAVFNGRGTNISLQDLERQVILQWLPTSGYQCANAPDIELYLQADPKDAIYEYWLPVI